MRKRLLYEALSYIFAFTSGLLVSYFVFHEFLFPFNKMVMINHEINKPFIKPGLASFDIILIKNSQFSIIIFLLGFNEFIQYVVMFIAGFVNGLLLSPLMPICAVLGILPHGLLELAGYALAGVGGYEYFSLHVISLKDSLIKYLLPSLVLLIVAAFIETFITLKVVLIIPMCNA